MEFGKTDNISQINWELPPQDERNLGRFGRSDESLSLYFGSPAWGVKDWVGKLYPPKTKPEDFLYYYSRHFDCIELNTSHYRIPEIKTTNQWLQKIPETFLFCPKVFKEISHRPFGLLDQALLGQWYEFLERLGPHLGPCFIQFSEYFSYDYKKTLFQFCESWPKNFRLSIEFRHPSWFNGHGHILAALGDYLYKKNIGLVTTDVAGRRDVLHSSLTAPWSMIRLIGNELDQSDENRLYNWKMRILDCEKQGLEEAFLFLHQPDDLLTLEFKQLADSIYSKMPLEQQQKFSLFKEI